jgi:hypothetical protein
MGAFARLETKILEGGQKPKEEGEVIELDKKVGESERLQPKVRPCMQGHEDGCGPFGLGEGKDT